MGSRQMMFEDFKTIKLDKTLTALDKFVLGFCKVLSNHVEYVVVSGYVSILFGRARSTEDIDILIESCSKRQAAALFSALTRRGYWCLNSRTQKTMFEVLSGGLALRFAKKNRMIPNFELKMVKNDFEREVLKKRVQVMTSGGGLQISSIEAQIAYKEEILQTQRDLEDARHLEKLFDKHIDRRLLRHYRSQLMQ